MKHLSFLIFALLLAASVFAQRPQSTETKALLEVVVTDMKDNPRPNEVLIFESEKTGKRVKKITGENGNFFILLPEGDTYSVKYKNFLEESEYSSIPIKDEPGRMEAKLTIKFDKNIDAGQTFALDIHFYTDDAKIQSDSYGLLDDLVEQMKLNPGVKIEVGGHTDSQGSDDYNLKLSDARAASVKNYLVQKGVSASRILTKGYGEGKPVASNGTDAGRAQNRRTEIRIVGS